MPKVSVIIPAYNAAATLGRAVQSVQAQTLTDWEMVIINDASTDTTANLAREIAAADKRIKLVELETNSGQSTGRNRGFAEARGEWLAILDADDAYMPERLQAMVAYAESQGLDMVADNQIFYDAAADKISRTAMTSSGTMPWTVDVHLERERTGQPFKWGLLKPVIRRSFWQTSGVEYRPQCRMGEDSLFYAELLMAGAKAEVMLKPLYIYTTATGELSGKASGFSTSRYKIEDRMETYKYFRQHYTGKLTPEQLELVTKAEAAAQDFDAAGRFKAALRSLNVLKALRVLRSRPGLLAFLGRSVMKAVRRKTRKFVKKG